MKVFAYARPPLNGRHLVGWAYVPDGPGADVTIIPGYLITALTVAIGGVIVTERVILLQAGQSPGALPGWRPEEAL